MLFGRTLVFSFICVSTVICLPEQGKMTFISQWSDTQEDAPIAHFVKAMYKDTRIRVKVEYFCSKPQDVVVDWVLRRSDCPGEYIRGLTEGNIKGYFTDPEMEQALNGNGDVSYKKNKTLSGKIDTCPDHGHIIHLQEEPKDESDSRVIHPPPPPPKPTQLVEQDAAKAKTEESKATDKKDPAQSASARKKREEPAGGAASTAPAASAANGAASSEAPEVPSVPDKGKEKQPDDVNHNDEVVIARTWSDGNYLLLIQISPMDKESSALVTVWMESDYGYLSATEWPFLPFFGSMCAVYVIYAVVWLVLLAIRWRDLYRLQFWVGAVIMLGMIEKAVFYSEYETVKVSGVSVRGAVIFAELVSCLKRTLARMLVIIVSLGYGIVKPRLGPTLHRVVLVGGLYFILASVEGVIRSLKAKTDPSNQPLLASIPLAVLDAAICWWVFSSLVQTMRTLRLRRNVIKLSLYRHFTNVLAFGVVASVAFMIWSIRAHRMDECMRDWKELWVDEAFWQVLFSIVLLAIMVLWRPTANDQRYAFQPLLEGDEEEELYEKPANDSFNLKSRTNKSSPSPNEKDKEKAADEDLKWVEENIPSSLADAALPAFMDSDEEMMSRKFEMSKMD